MCTWINILSKYPNYQSPGLCVHLEEKHVLPLISSLRYVLKQELTVQFFSFFSASGFPTCNPSKRKQANSPHTPTFLSTGQTAGITAFISNSKQCFFSFNLKIIPQVLSNFF
jgi:hypothetical protein